MTYVPIILDVLLGALLIAALLLGLRLDKRLKGLRESHAGFAQAVGDLDRAAARAEQGLADLRAATDEAAEVLAARIEKAQILSMKLDSVVDRAAAMPAPATGRDRPAFPTRASVINEGVPRPTLAPQRSRARVDDELFDEEVAAPRLRGLAGGR